jgi:hypothetical protein
MKAPVHVLLLPLRPQWRNGGLLVVSQKSGNEKSHTVKKDSSKFISLFHRKKHDIFAYLRESSSLTKAHLDKERTMAAKLRIKGGLLVKRLMEVVTVEEVSFPFRLSFRFISYFVPSKVVLSKSSSPRWPFGGCLISFDDDRRRIC